MGLWVGVYRKANTKWSPLLRQCEQRTRGAIRSLGRGIPGTRAALFSDPAHSLARKEAKFDQATAANSSPVLLDSRPAASKRLQTAGTESLETIILSHRCGPIIIVQSNRKMPKQKSTGFNPKKEVSVMAWIENDQGSALLVRQAAGQRLWTLPGGKVKRNESLESALKREVREETGLSVRASEYLQIYDRPKRGAITILFRVLVQRRAARMHFPAEEISDLGFFDRLPTNATPSAKFFWKDPPESHSWPRSSHQKRTRL